MRPTLAVLFSCVLVGISSAHAQQAKPAQTPPPTYQQTVHWILSKTNQLGGNMRTADGNLATWSYSNVAIQGCVLSYHVEYTQPWMKFPGPVTIVDDASVDVSIPMGSGISARSAAQAGADDEFTTIMVSTTQSVHLVGSETGSGAHPDSTVSIDTYRGGTGPWYNFVFGTPDSNHQDIATRMAKALNYLAGLCSAPKPREPF